MTTNEDKLQLAANEDFEDIDISSVEIIDLFKQRSATYGLLSRLYLKEFNKELLDEMHAMLYPADTEDEAMDKGYLYIATFLSNLWSESLNELRVDYARCFLGHGVDAYSAAYPYESVYTSSRRLMMEKARQEVLLVYAENGITKKDTWKEGEDHIALELDFMQIMGNRTIEALEANDTKRAKELIAIQKKFLKKHLLNWVFMLTADMKKFAHTKMYLGLAYLTEGFLVADKAFLEDADVQ